MLFLDMVGVAKGQPCGTPRGLRRQPAGAMGARRFARGGAGSEDGTPCRRRTGSKRLLP